MSAAVWVVIPALGATSARAQELVLGARLVTSAADGSGPNEVRVEYDLFVRPSTRSIPIRSLTFASGLDRISARSGNEELLVELTRHDLSAMEGQIQVPERLTGADRLTLEIIYTIEGRLTPDTERFDLKIPVVFVDWPPQESAGGLFTAQVTLPVKYSISETFPMVPLVHAADGGVTEHSLSLPVVPSIVRLRGRAGPPPLLMFGARIDLFVALIVLMVGAYAWRVIARHQDVRSDTEPARRIG